MIRVIVVDDHAVVRAGLARILERAGDFVLAGEGASGPEALDLARTARADVLVMDLDMPGGGIGLIGRLREAAPDLPILVLSQHDERDFALRCLEAGARGYVSKEAGFEAVEEAIRRVASGRRAFSEAVQEQALDRASGLAAEAPHARLTSRELEIVRLLARGRRSTEIARDLGISVKTVSTHRANALAKLGLENNVELALYAREHGLI
ncbi:MAG: response regulator transcription factor [Chloroflexi bacterium]|nr:response regulator transcription factor [Chloroflexota bacterium]